MTGPRRRPARDRAYYKRRWLAIKGGTWTPWERTAISRQNQERLIRQWRILRWLLRAPRGLTRQELARGLQVSPKLIHKDLEVLQAAGFRLRNDREESYGGLFGRRPYRWRLVLTKPAGKGEDDGR